jgi:hypothetical protein
VFVTLTDQERLVGGGVTDEDDAYVVTAALESFDDETASSSAEQTPTSAPSQAVTVAGNLTARGVQIARP